MKKLSCIIIVVCISFGFAHSQITKNHDFHFHALAKSWDEGIPLGNGMIGALVWQNDNVLRISLDRADLWDLRKVKEFEQPEFRFSWVVRQFEKNDYGPVQKLFDDPYDREATPTKIPGAAIEFPTLICNNVESVELLLQNALCIIKWKDGTVMQTFVDANNNRGWFKIEGTNAKIEPILSVPPYFVKDTSKFTGLSGPEGNDLRRLGYPAPKILDRGNEIIYHQDCSEGFSYEVWVGWQYIDNKTLIGCWKITPNKPYKLSKNEAPISLKEITQNKYEQDLRSHTGWWHDFWEKSSLNLPDTLLETQWYREMYKFGSSSRRYAPPITLQAVWTADNRRLPPWKGDYHNDLNTQLSYWPCYSSNHLDEGMAYIDWLWECKEVAKHYTKTYFEVDGLNFPGVCTLSGEPMGGWIQYALGPTVSAWLAHHFYLHWRYSMDREFLKERAYPWIKEVAIFLDEISIKDSSVDRRLPLSASPEINDNNINAWFKNTTNFDLALIKWLYNTAGELADELGYKDEATKWKYLSIEWPDLAFSERFGLLVSKKYELTESHRHFSHLMAIHPLGLLDWDNSEKDRYIIKTSLANLERLGTGWWCGYSYAWVGNQYARARDGDKAAEALRIFSACFCSSNSFHLNGDQSGTGKSKFTYKPFTLEGNFAFAAGIQEMLLQSQNGVIRVFPAIPASWQDVSFTKLRTEGAFIISAEKKGGEIKKISVFSEKGGIFRLVNSFDAKKFKVEGIAIDLKILEKSIIVIDTRPGLIFSFLLK